jgi:uncharacterized protein YecE (DUF72 family)
VIHFGPAGWHYKDWEGIVYPQPHPKGFDPLAYLADYFTTIEINSTYYTPATSSTATKWATRVEHNPKFRFTAKLWKRFTHERSTAWTKSEVREVRAGMDPMQDSGKLGAILLQFPWSFKRTDENREWLDDVTSTFSSYPLVLEVRHESWNKPEFYEELSERGIGFVNIDQPLFHNSIKPSASVTSSVGYIRVHGRNYKEWFRKNAGVEARYDYLYTKKELEPWAERAKEIASEAADTYVVTNNHYKGQAAANALMLRALVEKKPAAAPPDLYQAFPGVLSGLAKPVGAPGAHDTPAPGKRHARATRS